MDDAQKIRERARAAQEHVVRDQPYAHLFRYGWADLESRAKSGTKGRY